MLANIADDLLLRVGAAQRRVLPLLLILVVVVVRELPRLVVAPTHFRHLLLLRVGVKGINAGKTSFAAGANVGVLGPLLDAVRAEKVIAGVQTTTRVVHGVNLGEADTADVLVRLG